MKLLRVFFAISLPEPTKEILQQIQLLLKDKLPAQAVHWTPIPNLHVTLQFIRKINNSDLRKLIATVQKDIQSCPAFELQLGKLEFFPTINHPVVIALEAKPANILTNLATLIAKDIASINYPIEEQSFRGHLTLGRLTEQKPQPYTLELIKLPEIPLIEIRQISLFESKTGPENQIYTPLANFSLIC
ncbi:MAG: RNA 2',3'-cyclic phosphodiesterase [Tatlockia sp.]|nr:RNA 2',3'-cyclic phosphodiesterase [Tatlockia sp.]